MAQLFGDENYIQNSIVTSRIIQENSAVLQGTSAYGSLAILLDANMEKIDNFAEYIGMCVAQNSNLKKYKQQYGTNILGGFSNRNLGDPNRAEDYQVSRRNIAFMENMLIEAGIKISARAVMKWADEKDKLQLFELIYSILYCYAYDDIENGNKRRTLVELKKSESHFH